MSKRTYLAGFACFTLVCFICIAIFNYVVDPYRFFNTPDRPGINEFRNRYFSGQMVSKPYLLRRQAPEAVILGVSRAGVSLATDHPGWAGRNVGNYAIAGSSAYMLWRSYQHARTCGDLKQVVLMLDFFMFNVFREQLPADSNTQAYDERLKVNPDFTPNRELPLRWFQDTLNSLISFEMLYESVLTVLAQSGIAEGKVNRATLLPSGFWITDPVPGESQRRVFRYNEKQYMTITWFPPPAKKFALHREDGSSNLVYLRKILDDARREGIDVRMGFSPFHARLAESMRAVDIWDDFERWKKEVVLLVEQEAADAGKPAYPLWDFSGYNSITTETVPEAADKTTRMRWHLDATHVSRATGDLMQNVLLASGGEHPEDFGVKVDSSNIERYIERDQQARERYAQTHPADLEEVRRAAEKTREWRKSI